MLVLELSILLTLVQQLGISLVRCSQLNRTTWRNPIQQAQAAGLLEIVSCLMLDLAQSPLLHVTCVGTGPVSSCRQV